MKPSRRERRGQPLSRRQIATARVAFLLCAAACTVTIGWYGSRWLPGAIGLAVSTLIQLMMCTSYQLRQLLGLERPASRTR